MMHWKPFHVARFLGHLQWKPVHIARFPLHHFMQWKPCQRPIAPQCQFVTLLSVDKHLIPGGTVPGGTWWTLECNETHASGSSSESSSSCWSSWFLNDPKGRVFGVFHKKRGYVTFRGPKVGVYGVFGLPKPQWVTMPLEGGVFTTNIKWPKKEMLAQGQFNSEHHWFCAFKKTLVWTLKGITPQQHL